MLASSQNDNGGEISPYMVRPRRQRRQQQQQQPSQESLPRQSLVISTRSANGVRSGVIGEPMNRCANRCAIITSLAVLVSFWIVCFMLLVTHQSESLRTTFGGEKGTTTTKTIRSVSSAVHDLHGQMEGHRLGLGRGKQANLVDALQQKGVLAATAGAKPHLLSRMPNKVVATADVRGNLGPVSVVIQAKPGIDWIHDRWQAASNMHGKQIPGKHWIQLEFQNTTVIADTIVLDWETAYADEYVLEASLKPIPTDGENDNEKGDVWVLFDGRKSQDITEMRSVTKSGKSPGVEEPLPLHIVHEIQLNGKEHKAINHPNHHRPFSYLRLHILKSKTGWGVSLWQFDVYGFRTDELQTSR